MSDERKKSLAAMQAEIDELSAMIDELKVQAALGKMEAQDKVQEIREQMREKIRPFRARLKQAAEATDLARGDLEEGLREAWAEAKKSVRSAIDRYR